MVRPLASAALAAVLLGPFGSPAAASLSGPQLVEQLRAGGCVMVLRHAESPPSAPNARETEPDNPHRERQLNDVGKASARALGAALHRLHIPVGLIYSSPTFRALETVRLARLGAPVTVPELAEGANGMSGAAEQSRASWLQHAVRHRPPAGTNMLIVTHTPNIVGAFGSEAAGIQAGEMLVFRPRGRGAVLLGRIRIEDWRSLAR